MVSASLGQVFFVLLDLGLDAVEDVVVVEQVLVGEVVAQPEDDDLALGVGRGEEGLVATVETAVGQRYGNDFLVNLHGNIHFVAILL